MRIKRNSAAATAAVTATALVGLASGPATAAPGEPPPPGTAEGTATALELALAGQTQGTGTVVASNDGSGQTKTGNANPPIDVLDNQGLINAGVLAQDAVARKNGTTAACAGVAGEGGSVAEIGDSNCIKPGEPVGLTVGNLDLTGLKLADPEGALEQLNLVGDPLIENLVGPLTNAISDGIGQALGDTAGITGSFDVIASQCQASPDSASGDATITDPKLTATFMDQEVTLVDLPANPSPNETFTVDLDKITNTLLNAVRTQLNEGLNGAAAPLAPAIKGVQDQLVANLIAPLGEALKPLQENVLKLVLNQQQKSGDNRIEVTALHAEVLPAAEQFAGASLLEGDIATVTCDGGQAAAPEPTPEPEPEPSPEPEKDQPVPTTITSGTDGGAQGEAGATDDTELTAATGAGGAAVALAALVSGGLLLRRRTHR